MPCTLPLAGTPKYLQHDYRAAITESPEFWLNGSPRDESKKSPQTSRRGGDVSRPSPKTTYANRDPGRLSWLQSPSPHTGIPSPGLRNLRL